MTQSTPTIVNVRELAAVLKKHYLLWTLPAVALTLLALAYALMKAPQWQASQALLVRDEAAGNDSRPGHFAGPEAMKSAQEMVVEMARNNRVVEAALLQLGPPADRKASEAWPTGKEVEAIRDNIRVSAPKGVELGKTEVIYLHATSSTRERAIELATAVCEQMERRLQDLRNRKAASIIAELENSTRLSKAALDEATARLEAMETEVGSDLGELRILNESGSGDSNLRANLTQIKTDLRQVRAKYEANQQLLVLLTAAQKDSDQLVATSNQLLESQPSLRRLKDALVDAQVRRAELGGRLNPDHPLFQAAVGAEQLVRDKLHDELDVAIRGAQADLTVSEALLASLEQQAADVSARLDRLAKLRARYGNLVADVKQRSAILETSQKELADARASQGAAQSTSLVTRLDAPQTGNSPLGPGKATIVGCGVLGGLLTGFGLVLLFTPSGNQAGRRWTDQLLSFGRRTTDRVIGRRATDVPATRGVNGRANQAAAASATGGAPYTERRAGEEVAAAAAGASQSADRRANHDRRASGLPL